MAIVNTLDNRDILCRTISQYFFVMWKNSSLAMQTRIRFAKTIDFLGTDAAKIEENNIRVSIFIYDNFSILRL